LRTWDSSSYLRLVIELWYILKDFGFLLEDFFEDYIFSWWNIWVPSALVIVSHVFFLSWHIAFLCNEVQTMYNVEQTIKSHQAFIVSFSSPSWLREMTTSDVFGDIVRSSRSIVMGNLCFSILCQCCHDLLIQTSNWCSTHLVSPWNLKCFVSVKCGWFLWGKWISTLSSYHASAMHNIMHVKKFTLMVSNQVK
jgi:hypothetical protein